MKTTIAQLKKTTFVTLLLPAILITASLLLVVSNSEPHTAELNFAEYSDKATVLGGMLPASCESGGNNLVGPSHTSGCVWTSYCTGPNDLVNPWQIWQYSNDNTVDYRYAGNCVIPSVDINTN